MHRTTMSARLPVECRLTFGLLLALTTLTRADTASTSAERIYDATGVNGGLIVHVGCGDGRLTAALARPGRLVQGLDANPDRVAAARKTLQGAGLYGQVSVDVMRHGRLPFVENLVTLIVADGAAGVSTDEMLRVLAPNGVAYVKGSSGWTKTVKPIPDNTDTWTHYLHDASNNAVADDDRVGPPRHMQWKANPPYCRSHEFNSSISACVTAGGRIFYIHDEGKIGMPDLRLPAKWVLVARDAHNGVLLWKRPIPNWGYRQWNSRGLWSTPLTLPRRLVTDGRRVFVTLGYDAPVTALDAATGKTIKTYQGTTGTDEIVHTDGKLLLCVRDQLMVGFKPKPNKQRRRRMNPHEFPMRGPGAGRIVAIDPDSGRVLWQTPKSQTLILTLAAAGGRVCYHDGEKLHGRNLSTGKLVWTQACPAPKRGWRIARGTLVMHDDVVLFTAAQGVIALSAKDGKELWKGDKALGSGVSHPPDLFVAGDLVWHGEGFGKKDGTVVQRSGRDLHTGQVKRTVKVPNLISPLHHFRCYRSKATNRYLLLTKRGIEFLDLRADDHMRQDWLRAPCSYGFLPANGILYMPPHQCFCYPGVKLSGFNALVADRPAVKPDPIERRLHKGPAYDKPGLAKASASEGSDDWPTYRHDPSRSGRASSPVTLEMKQTWRTELKGKVTPPVIAGGKLYTACVDRHTVCCLDAATGKELWCFTAGGRVDSSPTVWRGLVLFGSVDGCVYCLRAGDGALVWRFQAAPVDRRLVAMNQVESVWPVHGNVVVLDDPKRGAGAATVYGTAGRSSFLDGGIYLYGLDAVTGRVRHQIRYQSERPDCVNEKGLPFDMKGSRSDLLVSDGEHLFLYQLVFDRNLKEIDAPRITSLGARRVPMHLMTTQGFLDDEWWDRTYWTYGTQWPGFYFVDKASKVGQILVFDDQRTYGLHVFTKRLRLSPSFTPGSGYTLFADDNDNEMCFEGRDADREKGPGYRRAEPPVWSTQIPVRARAMVLAQASRPDGSDPSNTLILAGPPDVIDPDDPYAALEGRKGAKLWAVCAATGKRITERDLTAPPVFDGMAAADGRLYMACEDGSVMCMR